MAVAELNTGPTAPARAQRAVVLGQLREAGIVENSAIARAELVAMRTGQPVEQVLNQLGALSDDDLAQAYAQTLGCEVWRPDTVEIDIDLDALGVTVDYLRRARLLPLTMVNRTLVCAACDPLDDEALSGLVFATGRPVKVLAARPGDWRRAFELRHATLEVEAAETDERRLEQEIDQVAEGGVEGAGARLVAIAFEAAIAAGASDIHFEPRRNDFQVRLRIDGRLVDHQTVSADLAGPAVSRVKVIANLDLGERRLPQDGRTTFVIAGRQIDVRVATSPSVFGESAVLRILDRQSVPLDLQTLGFSTLVRGVLQRAATSPHGMFLLTGPTGSGKTTTLYAMLQMFAGSAKKVLSVEDPVEYHFDHVVQTQVAPHIGLTFAAALRSFLRQDPDAILVGEIRDPETAAVAVQAAMTGHFVLASVHANHAVAVAPRLLDMGVEPYQLAAALSGAAAQRLVRRLCHSCRRPTDLTKAEDAFVRAVGFEGVIQGYGPGGCAACRGSGYRGRIAIAEAFIAQEGVLRGIAERQSLPVLSALAAESGLICMAMDGVEKASQGLTTIEEVMAAVHG